MTNDPGDNGPLPDSTGNTRRRSARSSEASSPVGSTLSIVLALVGVLAGFFILRAILDDDPGGADPPVAPTEDTTAGTEPAQTPGSTLSPGAPVVTDAPVEIPAGTKTGANVVVANASGVSQSAAQFAGALRTAGYTLGEPNATDSDPKVTNATSKIYYLPNDSAAQAVAATLSSQMGGIAPEPMPVPIPVTGASIGNGTVLVMLGRDFAGKQLQEPAAATATAPAAAAAPGSTAAG